MAVHFYGLSEVLCESFRCNFDLLLNGTEDDAFVLRLGGDGGIH